MSHLLLSAAHKSSGKTTITLGICAALARSGYAVQPFKKGPDYIDPMWLGRAAGRPCFNLDFNTMEREEIHAFFHRYNSTAELSLIEGNMGLFDSLDIEGRESNAELAKLLKAPVVLILDVKGATRSIVPIILGFQQFDPELNIAGLILNKVAGQRHEARLREVIAHYCDIPVIGAIHRDERLAIDERHLGLIPSNEADEVETTLNGICEIITSQVDLEALKQIAATAPSSTAIGSPSPQPEQPAIQNRVRIAVAQDAAFGFYYPDDMEAFKLAGADLIPFSPISDSALPAEIDGLFIGGGFPETQLADLESNVSMRRSILDAIEAGMPAYAECGGLMYLSRSIRWGDHKHEMVGVIPGDTTMHDKPVGRGYARIVETGHSPWPQRATGASYRVHEFHYSSLENLPAGLHYAYKLERGYGIDGYHDGFIYKNLLANYVHFRNVPGNRWVEHFVKFIQAKRHERQSANHNAHMGTAPYSQPFI